VHIVLKVGGVAEERAAAARGVALAALDDAHRVVLAVAPAAGQARANLERRLARAHLEAARGQCARVSRERRHRGRLSRGV
jgi:hypothetical protein